ncbi:MAG: hypothetical protein HC859_00585 [Bacteroidia bacterium]|nr:hypothetical protein [Bacteroidia bacterium]
MKWLLLAILSSLSVLPLDTLPETSSGEVIYAGCTPADTELKQLLRIPAATLVDFVRWRIQIRESDKRFQIEWTYGESQPNTLGFKQGGTTKSTTGTVTVARRNDNILSGTIYQLHTSSFASPFTLFKVNQNLLHILTADSRLMVGNGGWSYTFNKIEPDANRELPKFKAARMILTDTASQLTFDGRTPCQDIARDNQWNVSDQCFKLKWRLVLKRDAGTHKPTTYQFRRVMDNKPGNIEGTWAIVEGTEPHRDAIVIRLDPDKPEKTLSLLVGDDHVLYFLDKNDALRVGNDNFSYTLNRKL